MGQKIKLDGQEFDSDDLSDHGRQQLEALQFSVSRIRELTNMQALLTRAKNSYLESIKKEILSAKAGFLLDDD